MFQIYEKTAELSPGFASAMTSAVIIATGSVDTAYAIVCGVCNWSIISVCLNELNES